MNAMNATTPDEQAINEVYDELRSARTKHNEFHSAHEGLSVIHEEYRELESEVYKRREQRDNDRLRKEAMQIAAMAIRFMVDITG